ncbi:MAG: hypothetical protein BWX86_02302 [Verrucomicrobia bacterium ADurb.Bin122]|nr:MAG: hypothetical protein BWX86_02302 [Verrucomicrobia bacterium ADurb.Bin122]
MRCLVLFALLGLSALSVMLSGCKSMDASVVYTLYGGERLVVPMTRQGHKPPNDDAIQIVLADFKPSRENKRLDYIFIFGVRKPIAVTSVKVEDYTNDDAPPVLLVDDKSPILKQNVWTNDLAHVEGTDARLKWAYYEVSTPCIYRFTITLADGSKHVLTHVVVFPGYLKPMLREILGLSTKP